MCLTDFPAAVARAKALRNIRAMSRLRRYQEALAAEVLRPGNHVIHLQTGAGKTLIAFHLILEALERHRGKLVYFLAPTVPLVRQQHEDFQTEVRAKSLSIQAGILAGGRRTNLGRCHVVFATPGSVREDIVGGHLSTISLVVLDDACPNRGALFVCKQASDSRSLPFCSSGGAPCRGQAGEWWP